MEDLFCFGCGNGVLTEEQFKNWQELIKQIYEKNESR